MEVDALSPEEQQLLRRIRVRKVQLRAAHQRKKSVTNNQAVLPRAADPERKLTTSSMRVSAPCRSSHKSGSGMHMAMGGYIHLTRVVCRGFCTKMRCNKRRLAGEVCCRCMVFLSIYARLATFPE